MQDFPINKFNPDCQLLTPSKNFKALRFKLLDSVTVWDNENKYIIVVLPKGFISNGADTPRLFQPIFPPYGVYLGAAFIHDWFCDRAKKTGLYEYRQEGDESFEEWVRMCGVGRFRAKVMGKSVIARGKYLKLRGRLK